MSEVWKQIDGFDGNYDVSSLGRVRSWKAKGSWSRSDRAFILKPVNGAYGYKFVSPGHRGKIKQFAIHRLVAGAFHPNPLVLSQVNHIDNNRENNAAVNLEWCDHRANMHLALRAGDRRCRYGEARTWAGRAVVAGPPGSSASHGP